MKAWLRTSCCIFIDVFNNIFCSIFFVRNVRTYVFVYVYVYIAKSKSRNCFNLHIILKLKAYFALQILLLSHTKKCEKKHNKNGSCSIPIPYFYIFVEFNMYKCKSKRFSYTVLRGRWILNSKNPKKPFIMLINAFKCNAFSS